MTDDTYSIGAASKLFFVPSSWWSQAALSEKPLFLCYNNAPALWVLVLLSLLLLLPPSVVPSLQSLFATASAARIDFSDWYLNWYSDP